MYHKISVSQGTSYYYFRKSILEYYKFYFKVGNENKDKNNLK